MCWAEPTEEKSYRAVSRDTQDLYCFGGREGVTACEQYQRAVATDQPHPAFDRAMAGRPDDTPRASRSRPTTGDRRRVEQARAQVIFYLSWAIPLALTAILLALMLR